MLVSGFCPLRPFSSTARLLFLTSSCQSAADSFPQSPAKKASGVQSDGLTERPEITNQHLEELQLHSSLETPSPRP